MNAKQKYNSIIQAIEDDARNQNLSVSEITDKVLKQSGMGVRELNSVMTFLTENTLRSYIVYRKMMASYLYIFETEEFDVEKAVAISGYDNQNSFTKAFTNIFEMAPKETFNSNKESLYKEPLMWDCISDDVVSQINIAKEIQPVKKETIFGIDLEQYDRVLEASELQELYGFDRIYSQVAYDVSMQWKVPLKEAFEYMESWRTFIEEDYTVVDPLCAYSWLSKNPGTIQNKSDFEDILRWEYAFNDTIKFLYFSAGLSVTLSIITMWRMVDKDMEVDITEINPFFIYEYAHTEYFRFNVFMNDCQFFVDSFKDCKYDQDDFEEYFETYLEALCRGLSKEEAFEIVEMFGIDTKNLDGLSLSMTKAAKEEIKRQLFNSFELEIEVDNDNENESSNDYDDYDPDNPDPYDSNYPWLPDEEDLKRRKYNMLGWDEDDEDWNNDDENWYEDDEHWYVEEDKDDD